MAPTRVLAAACLRGRAVVTLEGASGQIRVGEDRDGTFLSGPIWPDDPSGKILVGFARVRARPAGRDSHASRERAGRGPAGGRAPVRGGGADAASRARVG